MKLNLTDAARVIRSKNAGPFELTLDIMFKDAATFALFRARDLITAAGIAAAYGVPRAHVLNLVWFEPSNAVKITLRRRFPSGAPGETDIYGAQQHAPLLGLEFEVDG